MFLSLINLFQNTKIIIHWHRVEDNTIFDDTVLLSIFFGLQIARTFWGLVIFIKNFAFNYFFTCSL